MDLVGGYGDRIGTQRLGGERDLQKALDRVGVEVGIRAELVGKLCHLRDGHDGAYLVVDHHNGHQDGIGPQGGFQGIQGNGAGFVRLEIGDLEALGFQRFGAVQNGVVLDGGGDDVLAPLAQPLDGTENGQLSASVPPEVKNSRSGSAPRAVATCVLAVRRRLAASIPKLYNELGLAQFSVRAKVMASTASGQGLVVAELSR